MARILLIDDDRVIRTAMGRVLVLAGHEVVQAETGSTALQNLDDGSWDLVITDINMPDGNGIEVILELAERRPAPPIVAISGGGYLPAESLLADAGLLGAARTLAKPFEMHDFQTAVEEALRTVVDSG